MNFNIDIKSFLNVLPLIGKGMLGIFAVTLVIVICIWLLNKIPAGKDEAKK